MNEKKKKKETVENWINVYIFVFSCSKPSSYYIYLIYYSIARLVTAKLPLYLGLYII